MGSEQLAEDGKIEESTMGIIKVLLCHLGLDLCEAQIRESFFTATARRIEIGK